MARVPVVEVDAEVSRLSSRSRLTRATLSPPLLVHSAQVAMCDGGGGATGHPIEYIKLDLKEGAGTVNTCKYCGVRYKMKAHHH